MMKKLIAILLLATFVQTLFAQPEARRREQQTARKQRNERLTTRAQISFPVAETMPEDVVWRRDIYREIRIVLSRGAGGWTDEPLLLSLQIGVERQCACLRIPT